MKQKASSMEHKKEEPVAPVQVEDMSDKPFENNSPNLEGEEPFQSFKENEGRVSDALQKAVADAAEEKTNINTQDDGAATTTEPPEADAIVS